MKIWIITAALTVFIGDLIWPIVQQPLPGTYFELLAQEIRAIVTILLLVVIWVGAALTAKRIIDAIQESKNDQP
jgi:uncharacterized membrane protein YhaH (DUF805 family)